MDQSTATSEEHEYPKVNYLNADQGIMSWLTTVDHKRIGLMYLVLTFVAACSGVCFAMLVRFEHLTPGPTIMGANVYNRMFTLHGVIMIFLFMIPAIPGIFGNFFLPLMLGAQDVAFPKLNLLSVYVFFAGGLLAVVSIVGGGLDAGWTFYAPYSLTTPGSLFPALVGIFILGFASILTGLELHRDHPHHAPRGHDLDADASVRVGRLRDQPDSNPGNAGHRHDGLVGWHRACFRLRFLRPNQGR